MLRSSFGRFFIVGVTVSLVDIILFVSLHNAGLGIIVANIISTSIALVVSLLLNYNFTFRGQSLSRTRIAIYLAVTLAGIWILQPLVITGALALNHHAHFTTLAINIFGHADQLNSLFAKLVAIAFSLAWNYSWYSRVVFSTPKPATTP